MYEYDHLLRFQEHAVRGVRLIQTYLKDGEIAHRSVADSVEERELDEDGKEVFKVIKEL